MRWGHRPFDPDLEKLVERARVVRPAPDAVRARAFARARAAATPRPLFAHRPAATMAPPRRRSHALALAAALALTAGAVGTAGALLYRARHAPLAGRAVTTPIAARTPTPSVGRAPEPVAPPAPPPPLTKPARHLSPQESYAAELALLQRAQAAHAAGKFGSAISLANEHGKRFPHGRLAEEREALRVRALLAAGRTQEARRAVAAFGKRFPRSVVLPRLQEKTTGEGRE